MNTGAPRFTPPTFLPETETGVNLAPSFSFGSEQTPESAISRALAARGRREAQTEAEAKRKQAAIEFGEGPQGEANPFSVLKVLERNNRTGLENLENQLNSANLFYSGFRAKQLGDAATQFQQAQYDARNRFRGLLSDIDASLADKLLQFDLLDAQNAGGGGFDPGGGDSDRRGGFDPSGLSGRDLTNAALNYLRSLPSATSTLAAPAGTRFPAIRPSFRQAIVGAGRRPPVGFRRVGSRDSAIFRAPVNASLVRQALALRARRGGRR